MMTSKEIEKKIDEKQDAFLSKRRKDMQEIADELAFRSVVTAQGFRIDVRKCHPEKVEFQFKNMVTDEWVFGTDITIAFRLRYSTMVRQVQVNTGTIGARGADSIHLYKDVVMGELARMILNKDERLISPCNEQSEIDDLRKRKQEIEMEEMDEIRRGS